VVIDEARNIDVGDGPGDGHRTVEQDIP
jgi:hypothetical protein